MRRFLSALLLLCFGVLAPLSGTSVTMCLLDGSLHGAGIVAEEESTHCCDKCPGESHQECCATLDQLPDTTPPPAPCDLPPAMVMDLPPAVMAPAVKVIEIAARTYRPDVPIRGPDSPATFRAKLAVWRI